MKCKTCGDVMTEKREMTDSEAFLRVAIVVGLLLIVLITSIAGHSIAGDYLRNKQVEALLKDPSVKIKVNEYDSSNKLIKEITR